MDSSGLGSDWTYLTNESETDELITDEESTAQAPECSSSSTAIEDQLLKEPINPVKDESLSEDSGNNVECPQESLEVKDKTENPHGSDSSLSSDVDIIDESSDSNVAAPESPYTCIFNFTDPLARISVEDLATVLKNCAKNRRKSASSVDIKPIEEIPSNAVRYPIRKEKASKRIFKSPSVDHSLNTLLSDVSNIKQIAPSIKMKNGKSEKSSRSLAKKPSKNSVKRPNLCKRTAGVPLANDCFRGIAFDFFVMISLLVLAPPFFSYFILEPLYLKTSVTTTEPITRDLELFKDDMLKCVGLQHLKALEHKDQELLVQDMCIDNPDIWKAKFPRLVNNTSVKNEILKMFDSAQDSSEAAKNSGPQTKFSLAELIIRQMDYFEMIPMEDKSESEKKIDFEKSVIDDENLQSYLLGQLEEFIDVLDAADTDLRTRLKELKSKIQTKEPCQNKKNLLSLESRIYKVQMGNAYLRWQLQDVVFQYKKQDFSRLDITSVERKIDNLSHSPKVEDLLQKIMVLMSSNEKLTKTVSRLKQKNAVLEYGITSMEETFGNPPKPVFVTDTVSGKTSAEIRKEDKNTNFQSMLQRAGVMQDTVLEELNEVFKWNGFFLKFMQELKESTEEDENGHWSWNDIKTKITDVVSKTRSDLSEKLATVEDLDISKIVQKYIDDGKKPLNNLLDSIARLMKTAQTKGRELVKKTLPDLQVEFAMNGVWHMLGGIQKKWADMKQKFQDMEGNLSERSQKIDDAPRQSRTNDALPNDDEKDVDMAESDIKDVNIDTANKDEKAYSLDHGHAPQNEDFDLENFKEEFYKLKLDWFLQRALARESIRQTQGIPRYPNWYLLRGLSRWRSGEYIDLVQSELEST